MPKQRFVNLPVKNLQRSIDFFTRLGFSFAPEVIVALSFDSCEEVDAITQRAGENGGPIEGEPTDHGWMYQRAFLDPDRHRWEPLYMETAS